MFASRRNSSRGPIGLDIGAHSIKMIQLQRTAGGWAGVAAASRPLPPGLSADAPERTEALAGIIRQMLSSGAFSGRQVVSCLPVSDAQYKNLRVPKMPPDELAGAIEWEAADRFKLTPETMQFQFFDAGEVRQGEELRQEIILVAATRQVVDSHLAMLLRCGLKPVAIDVVPGALARCMSPAPTDHDLDGPAVVVLDVGYSASKVLITHAGRIVFFKLIDIGGQRLDQMVGKALNMEVGEAAELRRRLQRPSGQEQGGAEDAAPGSARRESIERAVFEAMRNAAGDLTKEVALCLRYYSVTFRGRRPETVRLVGGEAHEPQLAKVLAEGAGIRVDVVDALPGLDLSTLGRSGQNDGALLEWAVAAGLGMRAIAPPKRGAA